MQITGLELVLGAAMAAAVAAGVYFMIVTQRRKDERRTTRRRENIAHARAWDWLHGRRRQKMLEDKSSSPER